MTASLPMYDSPSLKAANDALWTLIRDALGYGPMRLNRREPAQKTWDNPDLVFSQTCSLPYRAGLHEKLRIIGTPDYGVAGCAPGFYRSVLVVRRNDRRRHLSEFATATLARNDPMSQSGWAAIEAHLEETGAGFSFAGRVFDTGAHAASARAVLDRQADIAALDAVTWAILRREDPALSGLRVLSKTRPTPGLPFITARSRDPEPLFDAVAAAITALPDRFRAKLMLRGLVRLPESRYLELPLPAAHAQACL